MPGDSRPGNEHPPALSVKSEATAVPPSSLITFLTTVRRPARGSEPDGATVPVTPKFVKLARLVLAPTSKIMPASPEEDRPNADRLPPKESVAVGEPPTGLLGSVPSVCVKNWPVTLSVSPLTATSSVTRYQMPSLMRPLALTVFRIVDALRSPVWGTLSSSRASVLPASDRTRARPDFPVPSLKRATTPGLLALVPVWIVSAVTVTLPDQSVGVAVVGSVS